MALCGWAFPRCHSFAHFCERFPLQLILYCDFQFCSRLQMLPGVPPLSLSQPPSFWYSGYLSSFVRFGIICPGVLRFCCIGSNNGSASIFLCFHHSTLATYDIQIVFHYTVSFVFLPHIKMVLLHPHPISSLHFIFLSAHSERTSKSHCIYNLPGS